MEILTIKTKGIIINNKKPMTVAKKPGGARPRGRSPKHWIEAACFHPLSNLIGFNLEKQNIRSK